MKLYGSPRTSPEARIAQRARSERRRRRDRQEAHEAQNAARARRACIRKGRRMQAHEERLERIKARDDSTRFYVEATLLSETENAYHAQAGGKPFWINKQHLTRVTIAPSGKKQRLRGTAPYWIVAGWPKAARAGEVTDTTAPDSAVPQKAE